MQKFVRVPHSWYDLAQGESFIGKLGAKRFVLWFGMQKYAVQMNMTQVICVQIKQIIDELNFLTGFKKASEIKKMLLELKNCGLIECNNLTKNTRATDLLYVNVTTKKYKIDLEKGFSTISINLYEDKIEKLNCKGFLIFCLLFKYYKQDNGNNNTGSYGYAEITRDHIGLILNIKSLNTISNYINIVKKAHSMIKIIESESYNVDDGFGNIITKWTPNRYIVYPKCESLNKYYIKTTKSETA